MYLTNRNDDEEAWLGDPGSIADENLEEYDGMIQISVWRRSYRVFRWRDGAPIDKGDRFVIKNRDQ